MSLDEEGFLSDEILGFQEVIRNKYSRQLDLVKRINRFCQNKKFDCSVRNKDGQRVLAACLMMKLLDDVQAAIFLIERGMAPQARQILRSGIENMIILGNVCEREEFFNQYILSGERQRLKLINSLTHCPKPVFKELKKDITEELIDDVKKLVGGETPSRVSLEKLAKDVGMEELYEGFYRLLSPEIHSSPRSLERYVVFHEDGVLKNFKWGPVTDDLESEFSLIVMIMLGCMHIVGNLFGIEIQPHVAEFQKEYHGWNEQFNHRDSYS